MVFIHAVAAVPEPRIAHSLDKAVPLQLGNLRVAHESKAFLALIFRVFLGNHALHHRLVMSCNGGRFDFCQHLIVCLPGQPPIAKDEHVGKHVLLFARLVKTLYRREHRAVLGLKACFVILDTPQLEMLHLLAHALYQGLVFVVFLFDHTVFLSQLSSPLAKTPLDSSHRYGKSLCDLGNRQPFKVMQLDGFANFFAQRLHVQVQLLVAQGFGNTNHTRQLVKTAGILTAQVHGFQKVQADIRRDASVMCNQAAGAVFGNRAYPRAEFAGILERGQMHPCRHKGILRRVLCGERVACDLICRALDRILMPQHQRVKRLGVTKQGHLYQSLVVFLVVLVHVHFLSRCLFGDFTYKTPDFGKRLGVSKIFLK